MDNIDESFAEEFKPITVPAHFDTDDTWRNKVIYALAQLGSATAIQVAEELYQLDSKGDQNEQQQQADQILSSLYDKGLIKGNEDSSGELVYNLSKQLETNTGEDTDADQR